MITSSGVARCVFGITCRTHHIPATKHGYAFHTATLVVHRTHRHLLVWTLAVVVVVVVVAAAAAVAVVVVVVVAIVVVVVVVVTPQLLENVLCDKGCGEIVHCRGVVQCCPFFATHRANDTRSAY